MLIAGGLLLGGNRKADGGLLPCDLPLLPVTHLYPHNPLREGIEFAGLDELEEHKVIGGRSVPGKEKRKG